MKRGQISSLVWLGFALFFCVETIRKLPLGSWHNPGPGFWPLAGGMILGLLAIADFLQSLLQKFPESKESWYPKERGKGLLLIFLVLFGYSFGMEILGFLTSTFLLMIILVRAVEPKKWIGLIGFGMLVSFLTFIVFDRFLGCQLPVGIWGF